VAETGPHELEGYYRELLGPGRARGKWVACPCEDVLLDEVEEASRRGYRGIEVVKRYTGLGTGLCQGRYCLPDALLLLSLFESRPPPEVGFITQRPPVVPSRLGAWAALPGEDASPSASDGTLETPA
jgi:sarcosine oxidase subunit beta